MTPTILISDYYFFKAPFDLPYLVQYIFLGKRKELDFNLPTKKKVIIRIIIVVRLILQNEILLIKILFNETLCGVLRL